MKNKIIKKIYLTNYLIIFVILNVVFLSCKENKKIENKSIAKTEKRKISVTLIKPIYNDGRISEVRIINLYDLNKDSAQGHKRDKIKLLGFVLEWNKYEAVVCNSQVAIIQLECNTMQGGTTDVSNRISKSASLYFKIAERVMAEKFSSLTLVNKIPNRDTTSVSFDFQTNKGYYTFQETKKNLESGNSYWSELFNEGKKLKLKLKNIEKELGYGIDEVEYLKEMEKRAEIENKKNKTIKK